MSDDIEKAYYESRGQAAARQLESERLASESQRKEAESRKKAKAAIDDLFQLLGQYQQIFRGEKIRISLLNFRGHHLVHLESFRLGKRPRYFMINYNGSEFNAVRLTHTGDGIQILGEDTHSTAKELLRRIADNSCELFAPEGLDDESARELYAGTTKRCGYRPFWDMFS
jgi:hypothetical protein